MNSTYFLDSVGSACECAQDGNAVVYYVAPLARTCKKSPLGSRIPGFPQIKVT